jgi:hypothetical protein
MSKQLAVIFGVLLTLGAAFAENVRSESEKSLATSYQYQATDISSRATVQVASMWVESGRTTESARLARPL